MAHLNSFNTFLNLIIQSLLNCFALNYWQNKKMHCDYSKRHLPNGFAHKCIKFTWFFFSYSDFHNTNSKITDFNESSLPILSNFKSAQLIIEWTSNKFPLYTIALILSFEYIFFSPSLTLLNTWNLCTFSLVKFFRVSLFEVHLHK